VRHGRKEFYVNEQVAKDLLAEAERTEAREPKSSYISAKTLRPGDGVVLTVSTVAMRVSEYPRKARDGSPFHPSYLEVIGRIAESTSDHFAVGDEAVLACSPSDLEQLIAEAGPAKGDTVAVVLKAVDGMRQHWGGVVVRDGNAIVPTATEPQGADDEPLSPSPSDAGDGPA
jgi:hypothetical protein